MTILSEKERVVVVSNGKIPIVFDTKLGFSVSFRLSSAKDHVSRLQTCISYKHYEMFHAQN